MNESERVNQIRGVIDNGMRANNEDIDFLFGLLLSKEARLAADAALLLSLCDKLVLLRLIAHFHHYPMGIQRLLAALFATADHFEAYKFLLLQLDKPNLDPQLRVIIIEGLVKTHYFYFPVLISLLFNANPIFKENVRVILLRMGLEKIGPFLALFPIMPYEAYFRDVFGDKAIEALKSKN